MNVKSLGILHERMGNTNLTHVDPGTKDLNELSNLHPTLAAQFVGSTQCSHKLRFRIWGSYKMEYGKHKLSAIKPTIKNLYFFIRELQ